MSSQERDLVWREIGRIGTCMMVTLDGRDVRARPMVGTADREENRVWFVAHRSDSRHHEIARDPRVCLAYADLVANTYLALQGTAEIVDDRGRLRALWMPSLDQWFEGGPDDEDAVLVAFTPDVAEVWEEPNTDIVTALEMLTSAAADKRLIGENRKVRMSRRR
jgi:general stress protein 26